VCWEIRLVDDGASEPELAGLVVDEQGNCGRGGRVDPLAVCERSRLRRHVVLDPDHAVSEDGSLGQRDMDSGCDREIVGKSTEFGGEVIAAVAGIACWLALLIGNGWVAGLQMIWLLLIAISLGAWALLMRVRLGPDRFSRTVGPWRHSVALEALDSITWKMTGGWRSRGTVFVRDRRGGRVPVYVGRFTRIEEWGPRLLDAAARSGATVDDTSRRLLEGAGAPLVRGDPQ